MAIEYSIELEGLQRVADRLSVAPEILRDESEQALDYSATITQVEVQDLTPVVTGRLRMSEDKEVRLSQMEARVYTRENYAKWVEGGRGPVEAGIRANGRQGFLKFRVKGVGPLLFRKRVGPAEGRFMFRKAYEFVYDPIRVRFGEAMNRAARRIQGG